MLYAKPFPKHFKNFKENIFIGVVFCKDVGLELATLSEKRVQRRFFALDLWNFSKQLHAEQLRTTAFRRLKASKKKVLIYDEFRFTYYLK